jgi:hypothetical protein
MLSIHKPLFPPAREQILRLVENRVTKISSLKELHVGSLDFASYTSHDHLVIEISSKSKWIFYWLEAEIKEFGGWRLELDEAMRWVYRGLTPYQALIKVLDRLERTNRIIASKLRQKR